MVQISSAFLCREVEADKLGYLVARDVGDLFRATFPTRLEGILVVANWLSDHPISDEFLHRGVILPDQEWTTTHRFVADNWSRRPGGLWSTGTIGDIQPSVVIDGPCQINFEFHYHGEVLARLPFWLVGSEYRQ